MGYDCMRVASIMLAMVVLMLAASAASATNEVYLDPQTVYIPECGTATVEVRMSATNTIDTWSTMIEFDGTCVNITDVDFTGGITPTNASWGHHVDYIYLGGTELTAVTGDHLLATLTVECDGSCGPIDLNLVGDENIEQLIAGLPDDDPPRNGTIYSATWTNGNARCRCECGDVNCVNGVDMTDVILLYYNVTYYPDPTYALASTWAGDVNCANGIDMTDVILLYYNVTYYPDPTYALASTWAGDVNCANGIDMTDVILLYYNVTYYPDPRYELTCCGARKCKE